MTKLKWCIKRTEENYKEVNEWGNRKAGGECYTSSGGYIASDPNDSNMTIPEGYTEITLDEFRLLTDPGKWNTYCLAIAPNRIDYEYYIKGQIAEDSELTKHLFYSVSEPVFNELQRMWKERESEATVSDGFEFKGNNVVRVNETSDGLEEVEYITDWREQTKLGIKAMNKVIKALDKQNKLLRKLIKKQNPKRHEKTIM